jgi:colanic acid biosynthesis glycosyl transferase WcaI
MSDSQRITFVEQFYYPEGWGGAQIPRDITIDLAEAGFDVSVICGLDQYISVNTESGINPANFGIKVRHVPKCYFPFRFGRRIFEQIWFCAIASLMIIFRPWPSILVMQTNPPSIVAALAAIALMLRRPFVVVAQDLYPEVMIAHGMIARGSVQGRLLTAVFRWAYRRASCVVSLGPQMTLRLIAKGVRPTRIHDISNWATGDLKLVRGSMNVVARDWDLLDKFVLLYSGNLGVAHDAETMVRAVALAKTALPQLRLVVVGTGSRVGEAKRWAEQLGLAKEIRFESSVPAELLPYTLGVADLALVTLLPEFDGLVVPSKLLGHMARGVPTLYVGPPDSDVAQIIAKSGAGMSVANGEVDKLASRLTLLAKDATALKRMGILASEYYRENLTREIGLSRYRRMVEGVVRRERRRNEVT